MVNEKALQAALDNYRKKGVSKSTTEGGAVESAVGNYLNAHPVKTIAQQLDDPDSSQNQAEAKNKAELQDITTRGSGFQKDVNDRFGEENTKRERQAQWISGIGDAISGFAGLISAANGGQAINTHGRTALQGVMDEQEKRRQERKAEIERYYNMRLAANRAEAANLAERRKRLEVQRAWQDAAPERARKNERELYQTQTAAANLQYARERARREGIIADNQEETSRANINKINRTGIKTGGAGGRSGTGGKQPVYISMSGNGNNYNVPGDKYSLNAILATIPGSDVVSLPSDNSKGARDKQADLVIRQYMQTDHAKTNQAFWDALAPYLKAKEKLIEEENTGNEQNGSGFSW